MEVTLTTKNDAVPEADENAVLTVDGGESIAAGGTIPVAGAAATVTTSPAAAVSPPIRPARAPR